jgi:hypothetical protein
MQIILHYLKIWYNRGGQIWLIYIVWLYPDTVYTYSDGRILIRSDGAIRKH